MVNYQGLPEGAIPGIDSATKVDVIQFVRQRCSIAIAFAGISCLLHR